MLSELADLCTQTVVWEAMTTRDVYGKPSYAAPVSFQGRRVFKIARVAASGMGPKGEGTDAISQSQIWILATPAIGYDDRVYISGDTVFPPILNVQKFPDETGDLFVKVSLGSANG